MLGGNQEVLFKNLDLHQLGWWWIWWWFWIFSWWCSWFWARANAAQHEGSQLLQECNFMVVEHLTLYIIKTEDKLELHHQLDSQYVFDDKMIIGGQELEAGWNKRSWLCKRIRMMQTDRRNSQVYKYLGWIQYGANPVAS